MSNASFLRHISKTSRNILATSVSRYYDERMEPTVYQTPYTSLMKNWLTDHHTHKYTENSPNEAGHVAKNKFCEKQAQPATHEPPKTTTRFTRHDRSTPRVATNVPVPNKSKADSENAWEDPETDCSPGADNQRHHGASYMTLTPSPDQHTPSTLPREQAASDREQAASLPSQGGSPASAAAGTLTPSTSPQGRAAPDREQAASPPSHPGSSALAAGKHTPEGREPDKQPKTETNNETQKQSSPSDDSRSRLRALVSENRRLKKRQLCQLCEQNAVNITLLPCGHFIYCNTCAQTLTHCGACHREILADVKTYLC